MAVGDLMTDNKVCLRIRGVGNKDIYSWEFDGCQYSGKLLWEVMPNTFLIREIGTLDFWFVSKSELTKWGD